MRTVITLAVVAAFSGFGLVVAIQERAWLGVLIFGFSAWMCGSFASDEYDAHAKRREVAIREAMRRHPAGNALR